MVLGSSFIKEHIAKTHLTLKTYPMPTAKKTTKKPIKKEIVKETIQETCCKEEMKKNLFKHHKKSSC